MRMPPLRIRYVFGLILGVGLCVLLFWQIGLQKEDIVQIWERLSWPWVGAISLLTLGLWVSGAIKWAMWVGALNGPEMPAMGLFFYLRHFAWQSLWGLFVHPSLAIIAGRGISARKFGSVISTRKALLNGVHDQALEFLYLLSFLPAGLFYLFVRAEIGLTVLFMVAGPCVLTLLALALRRFFPTVGLAAFGWILALSFLRVLLTIVRLACGGAALGLAVPPDLIAACSPVVALLVIVPLSPGNLGVAEWGWVGLLSAFGVSALQAGLLASGFRVMMIVLQSVLVLIVLGWGRLLKGLNMQRGRGTCPTDLNR